MPLVAERMKRPVTQGDARPVNCRAGGDKVKYMEIKLEQVLVSKVEAIGTANDEGFPSEKVNFSYGKIKWVYTQQKRTDGLGGGNVNSGWDLTANKAIA